CARDGRVDIATVSDRRWGNFDYW
nr:immunoglobulin heavy chain junction region [Macaca mulatta]